MRISDWSSDVCSSDLAAALAGGGGADLRSKLGGPPILESWRAPMPKCPDTQREEIARGGVRCPAPRSAWHREHRFRPAADRARGSPAPPPPAGLAALRLDRKSVESRQSVPDRVDLGGRRLIQTKTTSPPPHTPNPHHPPHPPP